MHRGREHAHLPQGREPVHPDRVRPWAPRAHVRAFEAVRLKASVGPTYRGRGGGNKTHTEHVDSLKPNHTLRPKITIQNDSSFRPRRHHRAQQRSTTTTPCAHHPRRLHSSAPRSRSTCAGRSSRASWPSARVASRASSTRPSAWPWPRAWESTNPLLGMVFWRPFVSEFAGTAARASRTRAGRTMDFWSAQARAVHTTRVSTSCYGAVAP